MNKQHITIIGAGPAGLGCALAASEGGAAVDVYEHHDAVGGLCRTIDHHGYLFDIGGHRFLTKHRAIDELCSRIMGKDMLEVRRLSRIYYRNRYFNYPLTLGNTLKNLGIIEAARCFSSYLIAITSRGADEHPQCKNFENYVSAKFGKRLYETFFKGYTEKLWGIACDEISEDWARQRIEGLSLRVALQQALWPNTSETQKNLYEIFKYPRRGPGQLCERLRVTAEAQGARFHLRHELKSVHHDHGRVIGISLLDRSACAVHYVPVDTLVSSIPLPLFTEVLDPHPEDKVIEASKRLSFRHYMVVNVIVNMRDVFPDQWIYVHDPSVKLARIQNYKNWSSSMVIDQNKSTLGLEYFCGDDDALWSMGDIDLIEHALSEMGKIGFDCQRHLVTGFVVRYPHAYPMYHIGYNADRDIVLDHVRSFENLHCIGRAGIFMYCNMDEALLDGITACEKIVRERREGMVR
ncbi:MAG: FAD-dependent oxidoreductase [Candidatus Omnitrophica bacterium]|nr:FAD-dependent oxidoreductase [Candidatus Omnitrophota bacterium]